MISCTTTKDLYKQNEQDWHILGDANWTHINNEITGKSDDNTGFLVTSKNYTNFVLELEFSPDSTINSGVFIRCNSDEISPTNCYELNIWDLHPNQTYRTGAFVTKSKPLAYIETIGSWSKYKIQVRGSHLQTWINEIPMVDTYDDTLSSGTIALQANGTGVVKFRHVTIKELN